MNYLYQTREGRAAIERRNKTANFYACVLGLRTVISRNPLDPIPVTFFNKGGKRDSFAIVRNRSETFQEFSWPSIIVTASKVDQLIEKSRQHRVNGNVLVRMADNTLLIWRVCDPFGAVNYPRRVSTTKGDCMGSHFAERENMLLPISNAHVIRPEALI